MVWQDQDSLSTKFQKEFWKFEFELSFSRKIRVWAGSPLSPCSFGFCDDSLDWFFLHYSITAPLHHCVMNKYTLFAYAISTTGIEVGHRNPIHYAVMQLSTSESFDVYVKRSTPLPPIIVETTGITDDTLQHHGISQEEALTKLIAWIEARREGHTPMLIAHANFKFFHPVLLECPTVTIPNDWVFGDTLSLANAYCKPTQKKSLRELKSLCGLPVKVANNALETATTVATIYLTFEHLKRDTNEEQFLRILTSPPTE